MDVIPMQLSGLVPVVDADQPEPGMRAAAPEVRRQLADWGFMAVEVPGFGDSVAAMTRSFESACLSEDPNLNDYAYSSVPQISTGGTHGFFPFRSEIPRLAKGVPDPKEFINVSGAMLDDRPRGAARTLQAFPEFGEAAAGVFDLAFTLITQFGEIIRGAMPHGTPDFDLSRDATNLRVIYYRDVNGREVLANEHSGVQMLGLQLPPSDQGLQYVLHDGTWVEPVIAKTDVVLCNIGRMLATASNDELRPSTHRVHCSPSDSGYTRLSSVLFAYPPHESRQWRWTEEGLMILNETWGDFIQNRSVGLGGRSRAQAQAADG
jgi:hypothetical protein